jgi:hypothetical protein
MCDQNSIHSLRSQTTAEPVRKSDLTRHAYERPGTDSTYFQRT